MEHLTAYMPQWRASYLRTSNGAEIDLILERGDRILLFEFELPKAPRVSRGFLELLQDLRPEMAVVVAPVDRPYDLARRSRR